ncbi:uncharacterized protein LOC128558652 [Mercenaria mercenaria]|uniref:uncharacterized protein LOC128558652 n=1 Tax=Mercenaria mercenaria TaxID=6596 RepID=UPI00234F22DB|nr:uncharacterized protein LOC128558652 [Mercenaria mercenaria]
MCTSMASNVPDDGRTCPVCFDTYSKPKVLGCGHTFCELCIHEHIMKSKEKGVLGKGIECPLCRSLTCVEMEQNQPETWAKSLRSNFALETILSAYSDTKPCAKNPDTDTDFPFACQPCLEQDSHSAAAFLCIECNEYQCIECSKIHKRFGYMKGHGLTIIEGNEEKLAFLSSVKQMQLCHGHKEQIQYVCSTDNELCCSSCIVENHKQCKTMNIKSMAETNTLGTMMKSLKELNLKVKSATKFWSARSDEMLSQIETIQKDIREKRDKVMQMFATLEKQTVSYLEEANRERIPEYTSNREACEKLTADIDEAVKKCECAIINGTPVQQYILGHNLQLKDKIIQYGAKAADEFSKLETTEVRVKYFPIGDSKRRNGEELGTPFVTTSRINVEEIQDCRAVRLELKSSTLQNSHFWYRSIDYLNDGRLVAVEHFSNKLLVFNKRLRCVAKYDMNVRPYSVKISKSDAIFVTTGEAKLLFHFKVDADDNLILVQTTKLTMRCDSLSPIDNNSYFVGLFGGKNPLGVVFCNGDEKDVSIALPMKQYTAENTKCVFDSQSGKMAISDKNMDTIHIFDTRSNTKTSFRCEGILQPRGMAYGADDTLFVCSGGTDSIVHVTTEGRVLTTHKLNISHPYSICVSRDKTHLAVANMEISNKQLQVFELK